MSIKILLALLIVGLSCVSQAALFDRGDAIYDDVLGITWLKNAVGARIGTWDQSVAWADELSLGDYDDWRLPSMDVNGDGTIVNCSTASEVACRDNELGYMYYYNLMGSSGDSLIGDQGLFTNIQLSQWSGTEYAPDPDYAWGFFFWNGNQNDNNKPSLSGAWAVRDGDSSNVVPLPGGVWLLGTGLVGLMAVRRRV